MCVTEKRSENNLNFLSREFLKYVTATLWNIVQPLKRISRVYVYHHKVFHDTLLREVKYNIK